ncbi:alpha/beta fold hydrolase [Tabrizicola sp.]|uniref:alpha/beta fold hydrolase n=1 Tax=Tabrizicola sp. TaxID=2005166 RepID=UPI0027334F4B|nr:alpha/beta hydrolase [Tabrizicola sp.]MDP3196073.1 alpha/beta hydrolase [Tabrizicola sp.]
MKLAWLALAAGLLLAACAKPPVAAKPPLYTIGMADTPEQITFLLPGALTTTRIFGPANDWTTPSHRIVEYRLPGMRGEPLSPPLDLARSARWIADYANRYPDARINLVGYSTGAAIAIESAGLIERGERVKVIAISSPTPFPGAAVAVVRGGIGVAGSALATGSLAAKTVWDEYFITLYLGSGWRNSPEKRAMADRLRKAFEGQITPPGEGRGRSQSASLLLWTLSPEAKASKARITFFHGENDPIFPLSGVRRLGQRLNAPLCVLPEDGHMPLLSRADLIDRVARILQGTNTTPCG